MNKKQTGDLLLKHVSRAQDLYKDFNTETYQILLFSERQKTNFKSRPRVYVGPDAYVFFNFVAYLYLRLTVHHYEQRHVAFNSMMYKQKH